MAILIKCDRCGRYIDDPQSRVIQFSKNPVSRIFELNAPVSEQFDCCISCYNRILSEFTEVQDGQNKEQIV